MVERLCKNVEDGTCPMSPSEWKGLELKRRTTNDFKYTFCPVPNICNGFDT